MCHFPSSLLGCVTFACLSPRSGSNHAIVIDTVISTITITTTITNTALTTATATTTTLPYMQGFRCASVGASRCIVFLGTPCGSTSGSDWSDQSLPPSLVLPGTTNHFRPRLLLLPMLLASLLTLLLAMLLTLLPALLLACLTPSLSIFVLSYLHVQLGDGVRFNTLCYMHTFLQVSHLTAAVGAPA